MTPKGLVLPMKWFWHLIIYIHNITIDSEKVEKPLNRWDEPVNYHCTAVIFRPSGSVWKSLQELKITLSVDTVGCCIHNCRTVSTLQYKANHIWTWPRNASLTSQANLRWTEEKCNTVLWSDKTKYDVLFRNQSSFTSKRRAQTLSLLQSTVQKKDSVMPVALVAYISGKTWLILNNNVQTMFHAAWP